MALTNVLTKATTEFIQAWRLVDVSARSLSGACVVCSVTCIETLLKTHFESYSTLMN
jgi:hypothetical protein